MVKFVVKKKKTLPMMLYRKFHQSEIRNKQNVPKDLVSFANSHEAL